ncbi:HNH endonuclease signature motif containing protein [Streptomyces hydrogenans]|uniref:HNH endonuclease n=1 Tax=Streptomyces hydrogenans TaxID=1873719 RepID=A0ABQ3PJQ0_9ACTN|nr:HNH endonuclease signature motif containing protein [Streptomyces hydrogenans]GHG09975.1 hypothetical protein GCM10018784_23290 [Streptomyces hydrogenans]GHI25219.1 hypothetical protein Shyd_65900 [Streptomyces hydrogenans]
MSSFSPGASLSKLLFGRAMGCGYPDCAEPLVEEDRGLLNINVEVAHIRAEKQGGPRYDPSFSDVNGEPNLMLLCHKHHKRVDTHPAAYPTEELLAWKERQVLQGRGGGGLSANQLDRVVAAFSTPAAEVEAVGILRAGGQNVVSRIQGLAQLKPINAEVEARYLGVRVTNVGAIGFGVDGVGYEFDVRGEAPLALNFPPWHVLHRPSRRLEPQENSVWIIDVDSLILGIEDMLPRTKPWVPVRFRATCHLGSGSSVPGSWISAVHLPIWKEHVTQDRLETLAERAVEARARMETTA